MGKAKGKISVRATKNKDIYLSIIKELVKERDKWEFRAKYPLPGRWVYGENHPRIGEVLAVFPNILNTKDYD